MRTLECIDRNLPLELSPFSHHLEMALTSPVKGLKPIQLEGDDLCRFLDWASMHSWRKAFEEDLHFQRKFLCGWKGMAGHCHASADGALACGHP